MMKRLRAQSNLTLLILTLLASAFCTAFLSRAQEQSPSLGDLARKERERKRASAKASQVIESLDSRRDCGSSWACFIDTVTNSEPAKMNFPDVVDVENVYSVGISSEVHLETSNFSETTAVLIARLDGTTVKFTEQERQRLPASGMTAEAFAESERRALANVKRQDGLVMTCTFQRQALKEFLEITRQGKPSMKDWRKANTFEGLDRTVTNPFGPYSPEPIRF
jgi:hypothetical protein